MKDRVKEHSCLRGGWVGRCRGGVEEIFVGLLCFWASPFRWILNQSLNPDSKCIPLLVLGWGQPGLQ